MIRQNLVFIEFEIFIFNKNDYIVYYDIGIRFISATNNF